MKTSNIVYTNLFAALFISVSTPVFADNATNQGAYETASTMQQEMQKNAADMEAAADEMKNKSKQLAEDTAASYATTAPTPPEVSDAKAATPDAPKAETKAAEAPAKLEGKPSPAGAELRIISPKNGEEVSSPVTVVFGLKGMGVAPAGVDKEHTGHHHLIIDGGDELPAAGMPMGNNVKHFGGGQTEGVIELEKGDHTLQLILGDMLHIPHNPPVISEKITITVK